MVTINESIEILKEKSIEISIKMPVPTNEQISLTEEVLGISFPPSFITFLQNAGSYALPYWEVYWIGDESLGYRNIIEANRIEREESENPLPNFLITFHNNGFGDLACFDTRFNFPSGEYNIVHWDHELSQFENMNDLKLLTNNFSNWLYEECIK